MKQTVLQLKQKVRVGRVRNGRVRRKEGLVEAKWRDI